MSKFNKVAVIGAGAWGSALSIILSKNVPNVSVWAREKEVAESVGLKRENSMFLPNIKIPQNVEFSNDPQKVLDGAEMVVWVMPIQYLDSTAKQFSKYIKDGAIMINAGKGIEIGSWRRPSFILKEAVLQASSCGSIMGPNTLLKPLGKYAEAVVALDSHEDAVKAAEAFSTPNFRVRPTTMSSAWKSARR